MKRYMLSLMHVLIIRIRTAIARHGVLLPAYLLSCHLSVDPRYWIRRAISKLYIKRKSKMGRSDSVT